jgi:hypothetical protein
VIRPIIDAKLLESDADLEPFYLSVGDCPTGIDSAAKAWWWDGRDRRAVAPDSLKEFEADWKTHGRAAGPIRNQAMVDAGADYFLAFNYNVSRGTADCVDRCRKAGIPGRVYGLTLTEFE